MAKATWTTGAPTVDVDADGTLHVSLPIKDGGHLAATLNFTLTAARSLRVVCMSEPGDAGLTGFEGWSNT